jgi:hypothetical protein
MKWLYRIFLMPYLERDRYFKELMDDVYENDIPNILIKMNLNENI